MKVTEKKPNILSNVKEDSDTDVSDWNVGNDDNDSDDSEDDQDFNGSKIGKYKCKHPGCDAVLSTARNLTLHMNIHSDRTYECTFNGCNTVLKTKNELKKHELIHRKSLRKRKCVSSTKSTTKEDDDIKVEESEDFERPIACDWEGCDKSFKDNHNLVRHRACKHEKPGKFQCTFHNCKKVFNRKDHLNKHIKTHKKNISVLDSEDSIDESDDGINKQKSIPEKTNKGSRREFKCEWVGCDAVLNSNRILKRHKARHEGTFKCPVEGCDYMAGCAQYLETHQLIHTEDRPYKCEHCDKCFKEEHAHTKSRANSAPGRMSRYCIPRV